MWVTTGPVVNLNWTSKLDGKQRLSETMPSKKTVEKFEFGEKVPALEIGVFGSLGNLKRDI